MTNTLITCGNKGLGYETARRLIAEGHQVHLGARDPERGKREPLPNSTPLRRTGRRR